MADKQPKGRSFTRFMGPVISTLKELSGSGHPAFFNILLLERFL